MATLRLIDYVFTTYLVDNRIKAFVEYKGESVGSIDYYPTYSLNSGGKTYTGDEAVLKDLENQAKYYGITLNLPSGIKDFPKDGSSSSSQQTSPTQESTPPPQEQTTTSQENISLPPNSALLTNGNILSLKEGGGFGATYLIETSPDGNVIFTGQPSPSDFKTKVDARLTALRVTDPAINVVRYGENTQSQTTTTPKPTPEQTEKQRSEEKVARESKKTATQATQVSSEVISKSTPNSLKPKGAGKLSSLVLNVGSQLLKLVLPKLTSLATEYGLTTFEEYKQNNNIESLNDLKPKICPTPEALDELIQIRDNILNKVIQSKEKLNRLNVSVSVSQDIVNTLTSTLQGIGIAKDAANAAVAVAPLANILGPFQATINILETIDDKVLPILTQKQGSLNAVSVPVAVVVSILDKLISLLQRFDELIKFCRPDAILTSIPEDLLPNDISKNSDGLYKGFNLVIEQIPFNDKLTQNQGVAYNGSNIALLKTSPSFTNNPNVLLDELKFIIDKDNLKAY